MSIHEYFDQTYTEWNIREFLNECNKEPFQQKIDTYLKSIENIVRSDKEKRSKKAQHLFDRYKKAITKPVLGYRQSFSLAVFKSFNQSDSGLIGV
ncbi:hypothetical protein GLOIN_2v1770754 [Rhizophagus irregularis DAOM 181602=DAOM 197198]|uniref:Uncharacterized protein n=1 Tax=Rhizophagus irregularis (strain DAOM 181602 / DAOM 197198 / MUCL 43194) TaxID=747089 RepID=A0A2P4QBA2_RHIID|nr:hypothetical protein GLOIN_2v1770754 [Rhizophagus irregularis DAOM 181602=DAOM 197198]POG74920.1 hypothetical protein GLOIN_2v1770754 [Rhizophagus irregularis DAOM 181602=DAOM 197198]GBC22396.2 hypothetical protein GLOIN_2v1770754 [Rhizophagus irregularis DAOM 181602=DAOM 197198]|eukprot:XP_025181786.1 hypothetical protein GLOIN_2v1770754 [Rhizophagus irregularis DAOM 181602=DAOM 197198]